MKTGDPHEHGDGAKFVVTESSPVEGNLEIAIYMGGCGGPMLGSFNDRASAMAFIADFNALVVRYGGEPLPVEAE